MDPLLSIVTVSLNAAATIEATLASVSQQSVDFQFEHICVDGGSSDSSRTIIDRWAALNPGLLRIYERDRGIFDAMNKGLHAARGEYVLFLNADDFLIRQDALSVALSGCTVGAAQNPDLIVGNAIMGNPGRVGFWRHRRVPRLLGTIRALGFYPVHQGQFSKRLLLQAVKGFDPNLRLASDLVQFYDVERLFKPSIVRLRADISFMLEGGAANAGFGAMLLGTRELFRSLSGNVGICKAAFMVVVKTLQSISELRFGKCPDYRWYSPKQGPNGSLANSAQRP